VTLIGGVPPASFSRCRSRFGGRADCLDLSALATAIGSSIKEMQGFQIGE